MSDKQKIKPKPAPVSKNKSSIKKEEIKQKVPFKLALPSSSQLTPYFPGILLFFLTIIVALLTYKDYGISYDEPTQRLQGVLSYNYIFYGNQDLFDLNVNAVVGGAGLNNHGTGFELLLVMVEKLFNLTDSRDIYLMRHLTSHLFFLISVFAGYILIYRLFKNNFLAILGFIMLAFAPRIYAHSFFNTKDLPFLSMFLISFCCCQIAFEKNKPWLFCILGFACGYTTSIRIMGVMLGGIILFFLILDLIFDIINKEKINKTIINATLFLVGFCTFLYLGWPYLWKDPINNFMDSLHEFSHFPWNGYILLNGKHMTAMNIPWTYFPNWFLVTNPELWLIAGIAGGVWIGIDFLKKPLSFLKNTRDRNFLLYIMCFFAPVLAVIFLHSVIYNDWRHLYFVYPSFVLIGIYFFNKMLQTRYKMIVQGVCIVQIALVGFYMVKNHPFHEGYFNNFVSHKPDYLHNNYEMVYWGESFKQGLDHLLSSDQSKTIKINCYYKVELDNNILLLPEDDRKRIQYAEIEDADYFITDFWGDNQNYQFSKTEYSISLFNSLILCVYKIEKDSLSLKQYSMAKMTYYRKKLATNPNDYETLSHIGDDFYRNANYDSCEVYYKRALDINSNSSAQINNLATIYMLVKKYPEAIDLFKISSLTQTQNRRVLHPGIIISVAAILT